MFDGKVVPRDEAKTTFFPSGVQPVTISGALSKVSRRGLPPTAEVTYTSYWPWRFELNASCLPSGL